MSFLAPAFLWSLLALLPLAAVYLLKVRPRKKATTAFFLWDRVFSEKRATSLFQRLRDALSLLLMALAFAALAFALARPEFTDDERKDLVLVIDRSASMAAEEGTGTRLEAAKKAARQIVAALDGNQRAAVASVGNELTFHSHLSRSPRELLDAIDVIEESAFPMRSEVLQSLGEDAHWGEDHRLLLLSDGSFEGVEALPESIEFYKIGSPVGNVGIVAADLRRQPDGSLGFFYRVASSFPEPVNGDLLLKHADEGDRIYKLIPLEIAPGVNEAEVFSLADAPAGRWVAELDLEGGDGFASDDLAWMTVPEARPVRVKVATADRFFFETSVLAFQRGSGLLSLVEEDPEITIEKGAATDSGDAVVVFTPAGESPWWDSVGEEIDVLLPRVLVEDHPVIRLLDASALVFAGAREITPPAGSLVLVESESGVPLIYRTTREGRGAVVVNLDPVASEFVLSAWFPVLIHGAATHLAGREDEPAAVYRPGDRAPMPGYREGSTATVTLPDGTTTLEVSDAEFGPLAALGFYGIEGRAGAWSMGSSLVTKTESLLDNAAVTTTAGPLSRGQSPSYWLIVLALLLLVAESVFYHRRKVG
ncbi:MAG: VWA domain-containing protein [Verrucomicrobiae bacterium]|nr:VWA domain-containing protein [Verrucomicrobiae bacterium]